MSCQICLNEYDHSMHKPYSMSNCPHTFCIDCLNRLTSNKCPNCNAAIITKHPNLSLMEFIPKSPLDIARDELEKSVNEVNSMNTSLKTDRKNKLDEQQAKFSVLKSQIQEKAAELIIMIKTNRNKLLREINHYELGFEISSQSDSSLNMRILQIKELLKENKLSELKINKAKEEIEAVKSNLVAMTLEVSKLNEDLQFIANKSFDCETGNFGHIIDSNEKPPKMYNEIANRFLLEEDFFTALFFYNKAIKSNPNNNELSEIYMKKAKAYGILSRDEERLECYNLAIKANSENALAHFEKAKMLYGSNKITEAIISYMRAANLEPTNRTYINSYHRTIADYESQKKETEVFQIIEPKPKRQRVKRK